MVEPGSSGQGPEVHSGPDDMAFVDHAPKDRLKRSSTVPKKTEKPEQGGIMGFLGNLRKGRAAETKDHGSRPHRDGEWRRATDTERGQRDRKRRSTKIDTDGEGITTDAGPATEAEDVEGRKADRKTKRAAKLDAEREARDAEAKEAEERRAKRKESQRTKAREERERRAKEEEEREEKRREEKRTRRVSRHAREEEGRAAEEEAPRRREKRHGREAEETVDEDNRNGHKSDNRRRSHAAGEKSRDKHSGDEPRPRRHQRSGDEDKPKRRQSTTEDRHHASRRGQAADTPYPATTNGNKNDKISSWVNSQMTDPPEAPPVVPTVIDDPALADEPNTHTLSSDEEARKERHRRSKRRSRHTNNPPDRHRKEKPPVRSSDDSYEADRYGHANGNAKKTSWFKKFAPF